MLASSPLTSKLGLMSAKQKVNLEFIKDILLTSQISQVAGQIIITVFLKCGINCH